MLTLPETFPHLTWYVRSPPPPSAYPHSQTLPCRPNLGASPTYFRFQIQTERWEWAELPERRPGAPPARAVGFPPAPGRSFQIWGRVSECRATNGRKRPGERPVGGASRGALLAGLGRALPRGCGGYHPLLAAARISDSILETIKTWRRPGGEVAATLSPATTLGTSGRMAGLVLAGRNRLRIGRVT